MITIVTQSRYRIHKKKIEKLVEETLSKSWMGPNSNLNIVFVGRRKMKELSNTYKHENVALPVLSFPYHKDSNSVATSETPVVGEVIICFPQAVLLAAERDKTLDGMLHDLVIHGINNIINAPKINA